MRPEYAIFGIAAASIGAATYKVIALDYSLDVVVPDTQYDVELAMSAQGRGRDMVLRTYLPADNERQEVFEEVNVSAPLGLEVVDRGANRRASWRGTDVHGPVSVAYTYSVRAQAWRWTVDPDLPVAQPLPPGFSRFLGESDTIQVNHPEIVEAIEKVAGEETTLLGVLKRVYDFAARQIEASDSAEATDALTTLRLREGSCIGRSRLMAAMLRRAGVPARLLGGVILEPGTKRKSHQWIEAYVHGHWVAFCPTNDHFAALPADYLQLYQGDLALFSHSIHVDFDWSFRVRQKLAPSTQLGELRGHALNVLNLYDLFHRIGVSISLLKILLMIPLGALVATFFRNVIGTQTYGTFLPALIAAAARETGILWGILGFTLVIAVVATARSVLERFELLHTPKLSAMLALVVATVLGIAAVSVSLDLYALAHLTMFPIAVLTLTSERFALVRDEHGFKKAVLVLAQTLVVASFCYAFMSSLFLQTAILTFPELIGLMIALNLWLGRWMGLRVMELWRFRQLIFAGEGGGNHDLAR